MHFPEPQKKSNETDNSRDTTQSEESSGSEDEEEDDDSEDDTADENNSGASTGERKGPSGDERSKSSPAKAVDADRSSSNGVHHNDKAEDDDEDRDHDKPRERDIREVDEFLENRPSRDKDEDSQDANDSDKNDEEDELQLVDYFPGAQGCRRVEEFHCLNRIEEGTYGVVYRAKDKLTSEYSWHKPSTASDLRISRKTLETLTLVSPHSTPPISDEVVALKRLKMENEKEGFPITSLREINTLLKAQHPNIVTVRVSIGLFNEDCDRRVRFFFTKSCPNRL